MYPFFESIHILDGVALQLEYHQKRMARTIAAHNGLPIFLNQLLVGTSFPQKGVYKWRLQYNILGEIFSEITPYQYVTPGFFKVAAADHIAYKYKYQNREPICSLVLQSKAQDIIMTKNGYLTDTSYANIVLSDGSQWYTPKHPMLLGTQLAYCLEQDWVIPIEISIKDLKKFPFFKTINAMLPFISSPTLETKQFIVL